MKHQTERIFFGVINNNLNSSKILFVAIIPKYAFLFLGEKAFLQYTIENDNK
jgi:hypothetical protein